MQAFQAWDPGSTPGGCNDASDAQICGRRELQIQPGVREGDQRAPPAGPRAKGKTEVHADAKAHSARDAQDRVEQRAKKSDLAAHDGIRDHRRDGTRHYRGEYAAESESKLRVFDSCDFEVVRLLTDRTLAFVARDLRHHLAKALLVDVRLARADAIQMPFVRTANDAFVPFVLGH